MYLLCHFTCFLSIFVLGQGIRGLFASAPRSYVQGEKMAFLAHPLAQSVAMYLSSEVTKTEIETPCHGESVIANLHQVAGLETDPQETFLEGLFAPF